MAEEKIKKILVVDDDPVLIRLLQERLSTSGFEVKIATEAADGLQSAMQESPDVIILDVMMPIINGYNFCRLLKSEEGRNDIPVILLTSRDEKEDVEIGMEMGANAYLTKPVNFDELLETVNTVLKQGSQ